MNPAKKVLSNSVDANVAHQENIIQQPELQNTSIETRTRGQHLADQLASQVGSWRFLIGQSVVLAGWIGLNSMPGVPHWDKSPFVMLNLVFSFASAYTAPIVLMSQNRQSEIDRKKAKNNHDVNLRAGKNIELLHEKLDDLHSQYLSELTQIVKQQQQVLNELKVTLVKSPKETKEIKVNVLPKIYMQPNNDQLSQISSLSRPFNFTQTIADNNKVMEKLVCKSD